MRAGPCIDDDPCGLTPRRLASSGPVRPGGWSGCKERPGKAAKVGVALLAFHPGIEATSYVLSGISKTTDRVVIAIDPHKKRPFFGPPRWVDASSLEPVAHHSGPGQPRRATAALRRFADRWPDPTWGRSKAHPRPGCTP